MESFGKVVRGLREEAGISLRKFALLLEMSPAYLSKLERDILPPPSTEYICVMADVLDAGKDELLAKAGRVAPDVLQKIIDRPELAESIRSS